MRVGVSTLIFVNWRMARSIQPKFPENFDPKVNGQRVRVGGRGYGGRGKVGTHF